jgi:uncharacterized tellurite resistance protein B-like protein
MSIDAHDLLRQAVKKKMPGADETSVEIVTAVTGLLASIAYADRTISDDESSHLQQELGRINGLSSEGVHAVSEVLHEHAVRLSSSFVGRFTRVLREELPEPHRAEVLDALLAMAAADGTISHDETVSLRNITGGLGLTQGHYNDLQDKYRDKLSFR